MRDYVEYEFVLPDGSCRYEIIDLTAPAMPQMWAFKRMHRAVAAWPLARTEARPEYRDKLVRRLKREHGAKEIKVDPGSRPG